MSVGEQPEYDVSGSTLDNLLTVDELAQRLKMRRSTVEQYAREGVLPSIRLGRFRRFVVSDVEAALLAMQAPGPRVRRRPPRQ